MPVPWSSPRLLLAIVPLLSAPPLTAQTVPVTTSSWHYWITAGAGLAVSNGEGSFLPNTHGSLVAAGTIQRGSLVASARWARTSTSGGSASDIGLLAGVGTPVRFPVRGSLAAGIGRVERDRGRSAVTIPAEVQLDVRLSPMVGVGVYGFGNFSGPGNFFGAAFALQIGRLR